MSVVFKIECRETQPGEIVCVVGSHEALGDFSPSKALQLSTTAEAFPMWTSAPIILPAGVVVQYKFVVQSAKPDGAAKVKWETLHEKQTHRSVAAQSGCLCVTKSAWGVSHSDVTTTVDEALVAKAKERQQEEDALLARAAADIDEAQAQVPQDSVASALMSRESKRRNFSQTLLGADSNTENRDNEDDEAAEDLQAQVLKDKVEGAGYSKSEGFWGVCMKHVTSLSALSFMADAAEKDDARAARRTQPQYEPHNLDVPIVVVTSEVAPYSKTGGLGLVASSYSYEFPRSGHRTMVVSPKYKHYEGIKHIGHCEVFVNGRQETVQYYHLLSDSGCDMVFVDHPAIERDGGIYCDNSGKEFPDNLFRFTLLSLAALEAPLLLRLNGSTYGDNVLFLANDWQAGLVPVCMNHKYRKNNVYTKARCIYAVHNLGYQGQYHNVNSCDFFGVDQSAANDLAWGNSVNLSKGALVCADRVVTVSPNYAQEMQTGAGGFGLQDFVRAKAHSQRLIGILNGIDDKWDPQTDTNIYQNYSVEDVVEGKSANKAALQKSLGLRQEPNCVLIGFTGRLTSQKGVDVIGAIVEWMMQDTGNGVTGNIQLIMMGNGESRYADVLKWAERSYPGRVCGYVGFDPVVEHKVMAGCDLFLMPSRYEPCGLPQMSAQLYGTLPIVTATGGLKDSVNDVSGEADVATGFHIPHLDHGKVKEIIFKAASMYFNDRKTFLKMQRSAMQMDFYWTRAIDEYERQIDVTLYDERTMR
jgi:starch synthase